MTLASECPSEPQTTQASHKEENATTHTSVPVVVLPPFKKSLKDTVNVNCTVAVSEAAVEVEAMLLNE